MQEHFPTQGFACQGKQESTRGTHAGAFGGCEEAAINTAQYQYHQQQNTPDTSQGFKALCPGEFLTCWCVLWIVPCHQDNGHHHEARSQNARQNPSGKQFANVSFGDDAVDNQNGGGRNHDAQSTARSNDTRRHGIAITQLFHGGVSHFAHGGRCSNGGAADGAKPCACCNGGMRQPAFAVANEGVCRMKQFMRQTSTRYKVTHQDEKRNN